MSDRPVELHLLRTGSGHSKNSLVRSVLREHIGCADNELTLLKTTAGRPYVGRPTGARIEFSLSHCTGLLAVAVGESRRLGVDAEILHRRVNPEAFSRFMSEKERADLQRYGLDGIVGWWVRKEAVLKAVGVGLRADPRHWPVPLGTARSRHTTVSRTGVVHRVHDVDVEHYRVAVACAGDRNFFLDTRIHPATTRPCRLNLDT
ncbi:4'-phosphopantetheinyl transferase family protein [Streptomyces sp. DSM 40484]|uniref:4'-phosphopantetheinyl transferase family protein n=1 Tax=Streptomyces kroppenstedtii TaxID=3051181 RepID=UPI0028D3B63A|nr:4'-phosphopantetheinyl transferase superfamily protein [Streptomyces sp. DSM 40484]